MSSPESRTRGSRCRDKGQPAGPVLSGGTACGQDRHSPAAARDLPISLPTVPLESREQGNSEDQAQDGRRPTASCFHGGQDSKTFWKPLPDLAFFSSSHTHGGWNLDASPGTSTQQPWAVVASERGARARLQDDWPHFYPPESKQLEEWLGRSLRGPLRWEGPGRAGVPRPSSAASPHSTLPEVPGLFHNPER